MAQWEKAQRLSGKHGQLLRELYNTYFPLEARHYFAEWLESQSWADIDPDNNLHADAASQLFAQFLDLIDGKIQEECVDNNAFLLRHQLDNVCGSLRQRYSSNPLEFARMVKHCLNTEAELLRLEENDFTSGFDVSPHQSSIDAAIHRLRCLIEEVENDVKLLQQRQEAVVIQTQELWRVSSGLTGLQQQPQGPTSPDHAQQSQLNKDQIRGLCKIKTKLEETLMKEADSLVAARKNLYMKSEQMLMEYKSVQDTVLDDELMKWSRAQQLHAVGGPPPGPLDQLQIWCQELADIIWRCRRQVQQMEHLKSHLSVTEGPDMELNELNLNVNNLLCMLVTRTFILDKQPPQVLKTMTRFGACVRLLAGSKLTVYMNHTEVQAHIINEKQARNLAKENTVPVKAEVSGEICNNTKVMDFNKSTGTLSAEFNNMSLKRIKRPDKKGPEHQLAVTEEKFCILFTSKFSMGSGELVYSVRTISLPVVVVVHVNQSPAAEATIMWDNAFSVPGRDPFLVPDAVCWHRMAHALSLRFESINQRGLSDSLLSVVFSKVFPGQAEDLSTSFSWAKLYKEPLPSRSFTFWEWFYGTCDLVKRHLQQQWQDGLIAGFVSRQQAEDMLLSEPLHDNFILRFSDSEVGGLTTAYSMVNPNTGVREVYHLQPWTARDFTVRALADRIHDLAELRCVYPNVDKDEVFGKYYTPPASSQVPKSCSVIGSGYVATRIIVVAETGPRSSNGSTSASMDCVASPASVSSAVGGNGKMNVSSPPTPSAFTGERGGAASEAASSGALAMMSSYPPHSTPSVAVTSSAASVHSMSHADVVSPAGVVVQDASAAVAAAMGAMGELMQAESGASINLSDVLNMAGLNADTAAASHPMGAVDSIEDLLDLYTHD
ncbi:signal transducer and activator of transcription 5B-like [Sycon ciliatum]|uniref:signal transducer and activator of transcription 5B-like n=1 Tax=Sycon ciliatum TaxID=27933 RepID=UPI0031F71922